MAGDELHKLKRGSRCGRARKPTPQLSIGVSAWRWQAATGNFHKGFTKMGATIPHPLLLSPALRSTSILLFLGPGPHSMFFFLQRKTNSEPEKFQCQLARGHTRFRSGIKGWALCSESLGFPKRRYGTSNLETAAKEGSACLIPVCYPTWQ